ncbi:MAG: selenocysteine-specific translation elongation factor [Gemmatimonadetes bacterium]|nr:selenocysteine-specific translation elongation factor [Gemmatimonadota bacterium]
MERHVVIGTAGHVDHGKTALVRALTGVDTDRWEEEKRRGITIDLGFAPLDLGHGLQASVVDVPGHEDFVRNMVAGATGVDAALLVIAADEGVMPQTVEHVAILDFLGVQAGVVALTKADLADAEWLELVRTDVNERLTRSGITWEPPVPVSSVTGAGLDQLRAALERAAGRARERVANDLFRLPVDRVFSLPGAGTVVTGTVWSGAVRVGEDVTLYPGGVRARVRSVEVHGRSQERATPGRRTALALVGLGREQASRGSVVVSHAAWRETASLDVLVTLLPNARALTQRSRVRLHLGTAEVLARVVPAGEPIEPGAREEAARLRLDEPLLARWGDRAVLRAVSPVTTVGGCWVVDPYPASRPRRPAGARERATRDPAQRVRAFVALAGTQGVPVGELTVRLGLVPEAVAGVLGTVAQDGIVQAGDRLMPGTATAGARALVIDRLAAFHREHPLRPGMPLEAFRKLVADPGLAGQVLDALEAEKVVVQERGVVRLAEHRASVPAAYVQVAQTIGAGLAAAGPQGQSAVEVAALGAGAPAVEIAEFLVREGTAIRVGSDRYYDRQQLEGAARKVLGAIRTRGQVTPSEVRDILGLTRKYLIPILEWMDSAGLTVRAGDARRLGPTAPQPGWDA